MGNPSTDQTATGVIVGRTQDLKRTHTFWSLLAYQTTILCSWSCNVTLYYYIFTLGGPAALVWGTIIVTIGQTLVMTSLAEYCSLWPAAGGQQYYTQILAPEKYRRFLSYTVGWCILVGEVSVAAGCALNSAQILSYFVQITHSNIVWKPYMTYLLYCAFLGAPFITGIFVGPKALPTFQILGAVFNVLSGLTWAIVFLVMAPKTSAKFVFTEFINDSGWSSDGWVFVLSFYVPIYGLYGTDAVMHLAEETRNASRDAPRVMIYSMLWAGVTAFVSGIIMCYTVGPNWADYMGSISSYLAWFMGVTRSVYGGGIFCSVIMMGLNYLIILNTSIASSRIIWSMAGERAFPFSSYLSQLATRLAIPLRALIVFFVVNLLIGILVLGSDLAFYAILSGGGVALQVSYSIPILCVLCRGRDVALPKNRPHFDLGTRWGYTINILSIFWSILVLLFYVFPQYMPVVGDIANMNWAIAILGAVVAFAGITWWTTARKEYLKGGSFVIEGSVVMPEDQVASGSDHHGSSKSMGKATSDRPEL